MDFAEYRSYLPGDDLRQIDWKLYSRSDRYYVKQFEGDTNTNLTIVLDASGSMAFGGAEGPAGRLPAKIEYGKFLAASLGYLAQKQRDRVGLIVLGDGLRSVVPNGARQLQTVLGELDKTEATGSSDLLQSMVQIAGGMRRRGLVAVLSDLYRPAKEVVQSMAKLRVRGADVVVFHILDPAEVRLPFEDTVELEDLETGELMAIEPEILAARYERRINRHIEATEEGLVRAGIGYHLTMTDEPLDTSLHRYLSTRLWSMKNR